MGRGPEQISEFARFARKHSRTAFLALAGVGVGAVGVSLADAHTDTLPAMQAVGRTIPLDKSVPFDYGYGEKLKTRLKETGLEEKYHRDMITFSAGAVLIVIAIGVRSLSESKEGSVSGNNHLSPQTSA